LKYLSLYYPGPMLLALKDERLKLVLAVAIRAASTSPQPSQQRT